MVLRIVREVICYILWDVNPYCNPYVDLSLPLGWLLKTDTTDVSREERLMIRYWILIHHAFSADASR